MTPVLNRYQTILDEINASYNTDSFDKCALLITEFKNRYPLHTNEVNSLHEALRSTRFDHSLIVPTC